MSDACTIRIVPAAGPSSGLGRLIASRWPCASVLYVVATAVLLPRIADASTAIGVFLAAAAASAIPILLSAV